MSDLRLFSSGSLGKTNVYFLLISGIRFIVNLTPLRQKARPDPEVSFMDTAALLPGGKLGLKQVYYN